MNTTRYVVALFAVVVYPAVLMFWPLIHPFVGRWRQIGHRLDVHYHPLDDLSWVGTFMYACRATLLSVEYGSNELLGAAAVALLAIGLTIEALCRRSLSARILIGFAGARRRSTWRSTAAGGHLRQDSASSGTEAAPAPPLGELFQLQPPQATDEAIQDIVDRHVQWILEKAPDRRN